MFKLYKCSNNGEFVILTDEINIESFEKFATDSFIAAVYQCKGDLYFTVQQLIGKIFKARELTIQNMRKLNSDFPPTAFEVHKGECKMIVKCGLEWPDHTSTLVYSSEK